MVKIKKFSTPILFLTFQRPDTTEKVFETIRKIRPDKLYIAQNYHANNNLEDLKKWMEVRKIIESVDWNCDVKRLYRNQHLNVKISISSAISWFFENEEKGIILEDDCLPHLSFYTFCEEMLNRYEKDTRIMMIGGTNYLLDKYKLKDSYCFSRYFAIWGWATWRRSWKLYDIKMNNWEKLKNENQLKSYYSEKYILNHIKSILNAAYNGDVSTWDTQWFYSCLFNNALSIVPKVNLISNIGLVGTNTSNDLSNNLKPTYELDTDNLVVPELIYADYKYDIKLFQEILKKPLYKRLLSKFKRIKIF
jgi:hypothetical protein